MQSQESLPDITSKKTDTKSYALQWVGMEGIAVPMMLNTGHGEQTVAAKANVYVSLDHADSKGIHMSRLYAIVNQLSISTTDKTSLDALLDNMVSSQKGISQHAKIDLAFDVVLPKNSLLSGHAGFQSYQVEIHGQKIHDTYDYQLTMTIPYSSTCPCSAALSRQLFANAIDQEFPDAVIDKQSLLSWASDTTVATPHSQRSYAYLELSLADQEWPTLADIVTRIEATLGTSVQTMVKRVDEQEFARLNAQNLMFCEDAGRRIKSMLESWSWVVDYTFKIEHQESLHAHNAVVIDQKQRER